MQHHSMLHILPLLLRLVIGELIPALLKAVVAPVVLEFVVAHGAAHRGRRSRRQIGLVAAIAGRVVCFDACIRRRVCDEWRLERLKPR